VTEIRSSSARSTTLEPNGGEDVAFLVREAAPKLKETPGPTQWKWERLSGSVHGEWQQIRGVTDGRLTGADKQAAMEDIMHRRGSFYIRHLGAMGRTGQLGLGS
jgi:hypothetical protein